jgi:PAS domain S-box-containing protein
MSADNRASRVFANAALLDAVPFAAIGADAAGVIRSWNAAAEALYGWTADEAVGLPILAVTPSAEMVEAGAQIMSVVLTGAPWTGEYAVQRKDGSSFLARVTLTPLVDGGEVVGMIGISEDVSDLRFHQTLAADTGDRLRLALDASGLGAWEWDLGTGQVHWDERMEEIFGYEPGTFPGTYDAWYSTIHPDDRHHVLSSVQQAVALRSRNNLEHRVVHTNGTVRWIESHSQSVVDAQGVVRGTIGCVRDITAWKHAELERMRLLQHERFLADASEQLSASLEIEHTLTIIADVSVPKIADWCVIHLLDGTDVRLALLRHRHAEGQLVLSRLADGWAASGFSDQAVGETIRAGEARLLPQITDRDLAELADAGNERAAMFRVAGSSGPSRSAASAATRSPSSIRTCWRSWRRAPRWRSTTPSRTNANAPRRSRCSTACCRRSRSPRRASPSRPGTSPERRAGRSAATGTTRSPCRTAGSASRWVMSWVTASPPRR